MPKCEECGLENDGVIECNDAELSTAQDDFSDVHVTVMLNLVCEDCGSEFAEVSVEAILGEVEFDV